MDLNNSDKQCKYLRGKNAYGTTEGGGSPFLPQDDSTIYWCIKTSSPVGPDNQLACVGMCGANRACAVLAKF